MQRFPRSFSFIAWLLLLLPQAGYGQQEGEIVIDATGGFRRTPIHVEEFLYEGTRLIRFPGGEAPEDILVRDLEYSSIFRVSRGPSLLGDRSARPASVPTDALYIATAKVGTSWGRQVLTGSLRDAQTGNLYFEKEFPLGDPPERWAIHAFADEIVLSLTGERGIAETRIVFVQDYGETRELHIIDYDGVGETRLTNLGTILLSPAWAPSADRLALTSFGGGGAAVVGLSLRDNRTWTISEGGAMSASPCWSPDGRKVAFTRSVGGNSEIFISDSNGGKAVRLTHHRAIDTSPSFSPDGQWIAFTSDRTGNPQIYIMDREGGSLRRLTFDGKQNDSADWSPAGGRIAFVSMVDGSFDICTIDPDGRDLRRLTSDEGAHENPRWGPGGRHLVYSKLFGGKRQIFIMDANGRGKRALTTGKGGQYNPAWSPTLSLQSVRAARTAP